MEPFDEQRFRDQVNAALAKVRTVLETNRRPVLAAPEVSHSYDDKYLLAEYLTVSSIAGVLNLFSLLGITTEQYQTLVSWAQTRTVTLDFSRSETCSFVRKAKRVEEDPVETVHKTTFLGITSSTSTKRVTKIKEWFWRFGCSYEFSAYPGNMTGEKIILKSASRSTEIATRTDREPYPSSAFLGTDSLDLTWLLQRTSEQQVRFQINRELRDCHTPRRNSDIQRALNFFSRFSSWATGVGNFFVYHLFPIQPHRENLQVTAITEKSAVFTPVVPIFEEERPDVDPSAPASSGAAASSADTLQLAVVQIPDQESRVLMRTGDLRELLAEQTRSIREKFDELALLFPDGEGLITPSEVQIYVLMKQGSDINNAYNDSVNYIERMIYAQVVSAIGKVVGPTDFSEYMRFHNRKLFKSVFEPQLFSHAVRRPGRFPEGTISIMGQLSNGTPAEPISTLCRRIENVHPMTFALTAATKVSFKGERYLHSWITHSFSGESGISLQLIARARQFSSFIMLVGRVTSAKTFDPVAAMIIQNKDELSIPLMLEQIPTPKEFLAALESLSPEQQAFCKAYRQMQLESTLFGVLVIQIKPQLERLLKLPATSLTKEIRLTQDLLELFITYQIPSDLLSYDGAPTASNEEKINTVKEYVQRMQDMIQSKRSADLSNNIQAGLYAALPHAQLYSGSSGPFLAATFVTSWAASPAYRQHVSRPRGNRGPPAGASNAASSTEVEQIDEDAEGPFDFTAIPHELDRRFARLDSDGALRPTIIIPQFDSCTKKSQASLLTDPVTTGLSHDDLRREKNKAFDLLDALSRSGSLDIEDAALHVVIAATHCFAQSLMNTIVLDNVNPIEKMERSVLIVSETIQGQPVTELVNDAHLERIHRNTPALFSN
jgi:hypothetical protein